MSSDHMWNKMSDTSSVLSEGYEYDAGEGREAAGDGQEFGAEDGPPGWQHLSSKEKWERVIRRLNTDEVSWQSLSQYEKEALAARNTANEMERTEATLLHLLAKKINEYGFDKLTAPTRTHVINHLLDHTNESSLQQTPVSKPTSVLILALNEDNKPFLDHVFQDSARNAQAVGRLIAAKDDVFVKDGNCLHYAFAIKLPEAIKTQRSRKSKSHTSTPNRQRIGLDEMLELMRKLCRNAKPESIVTRDGLGNTPIHYAFDHYSCSRLGRSTSKFPKYREILVILVERGDEFKPKQGSVDWFNNAGESPYRYYLHTGGGNSDHTGSASKPSSKTASQPAKDNGETTKGVQDIRGATKGGAVSANDKKNRQLALSSQPRIGSASVITGPQRTSLADPSYGRREKTREETVLGQESLNSLPASTANRTGDTHDGTRNPDPTEVEEPHTIKATETQSRNQPHKGRDGEANQTQPKAESQSVLERFDNSKKATHEIQTWLKSHYIRTRADQDAKEMLYGKVASDKNLYFDASHLEGKAPEQVVRLIEMLRNAGGFEDILSYVHIPSLAIEKNVETIPTAIGQSYSSKKGWQRGQTKQQSPGLGRTSLIRVFDTLWDAGVRRIVQLHVDDSQTPHADAAIEKAIRGEENPIYKRTLAEDTLPQHEPSRTSHRSSEKKIQVDMWNWQKPDLDVNVIRYAVPTVEEIHLYWSGNSTVLSSWGCNDGIPKLHVEGSLKLKTIHLHAFPGLESSIRLDGTVQQFQEQIERVQGSKSSSIRVKVHQRRVIGAENFKSEDQLRPFAIMGPKPLAEHHWVACMDEFRAQLISVHHLHGESFDPPRVKVALIDDGIDLGDLQKYEIPNEVQVTGLSYCEPFRGTVLAHPWHQSTHSHGTIMANMILRINPWASLDVMRIQEERGNNPSGISPVRIHARSAAKAIRGAILRKVNIISMSWTIRDLKPQDSPDRGEGLEFKELEELREAILEARRQNILMFCSASDEVQQRGADYLPFSADPAYLFRIGAANHSGQRDPEVGDQKSIDWFFPGNQVAATFSTRSSKILDQYDGSSVSTALAAGLASLIIYLANVMSQYHRTEPGPAFNIGKAERFDKIAKSLKQRNGMHKAFSNLRDETFQDKKFLPVWHTFGKKAEEMSNIRSEFPKSPKDLMYVLEKLVGDLSHKF